MEEARYWMWAKTKPESNPGVNVNVLPPAAMNSYGDSWEEQAFAEDAAGGALGGCVWPPRSYSCSFCRRDFRSAQALGGHMNVHRRDRARLKQSPNPTADKVVPQNHAFDAPTNYSSSSSHISSFLYNNPNPHFSDVGPFTSPFSRVLSVSSPPPPSAAEEKLSSTSLRFFSPNNKSDLVSLVSLDHIPPSWSSFLSEKRDRELDSVKNEVRKKSVDDIPAEKEDCVTEDLSTSLNLVISQRRTTNNTSSDEEVASCKRRRIIEAEEVVLPLRKLSAIDRCLLPQSDHVLKLCPASSADDELDLELRLGEAPKVK